MEPITFELLVNHPCHPTNRDVQINLKKGKQDEERGGVEEEGKATGQQRVEPQTR